MKVFYGVQGTGNGHITRARVMAEEFKKVGATVDFMFSGRHQDHFFDMEVFDNFSIREGLTFDINKGSVNYWNTLKKAKVLQFINDVKSLDLSEYDLVISDYEPVTSWAGRTQGIPVVGIGHQYAFKYDIPKTGFNIITENIMGIFAPTDIGVGLHWYHFGQPILPPIINTRYYPSEEQEGKIVVYLPFEDQQEVIRVLANFTDFEFHIYSPEVGLSKYKHIQCHPLSRTEFQRNLKTCDGIISNSGFELISEALELGKRILVKPVKGQAEQHSNALALVNLGYGKSMDSIHIPTIADWLYKDYFVRATYHGVAEQLVHRIITGKDLLDLNFIKFMWDNVRVFKQ